MIRATQQVIDRFGVFASVVCAIHCLLLAVAPTVFAVIGLEILADHETEWFFIALAIGAALLATFIGFRKHGSRKVVTFFMIGIALLIVSRLTEMMHLHGVGVVISIAGGACLVTAHFLNIRKSNCC
jgi:hypothetical protein